MKTLLLLAAFAAILALTYGHHGGKMRRGGGCRGGYDDDDDDDIPECGGKHRRHESDAGHGYGGYGRHESDAGHGYGGYGRHESDAGHGYGGYGKKKHFRRHYDDDDDDHVYRFQLGEDFGGYEYLDEQGYLQGFFIDLIQAVCKKAGKRCAYLNDDFAHCWSNKGDEEFPGVGLLDGWFDGCIGLIPGIERLNSMNFTMSFTPNVNVALYWREKDDLGDRKNLTGRKIAFFDGASMNQRCLKRQYNITGKVNFVPVFFKDYKGMIDALSNKEVDAMLSEESDYAKFGFVADKPWIHCAEGGLSVMAQYHSDLIDWWNCAFSRMVRSGEFKELCEESQKKHGHKGKIDCI